MIKNAPREFFAELGEQLLPLGEEIRPSEVVDDRIDLLALDADGAAVIIELKRALTYAALIADWSPDRLTSERARFSGKSENEVQQTLAEKPSSASL